MPSRVPLSPVRALLCLCALIVLAAATPLRLSAANTVLFDEQFTDFERATQNLPSGARWIAAGEAPGARRFAVPTAGTGAELRMEADGDYAQIFGYFTAVDAARSLAVGDSLRLSLRLRMSRPYNQSGGIRFGLFNSAGVRASADSSSDVYGNTFVAYRGYFTSFNPGASAAFELRRRSSSSGSSPLLGGGSTVFGSATGTNVGLAAGVEFPAELVLTRSTATTMAVVTRVNGVELSASDTELVASSFDTIGLIHGNFMPVGDDLRVVGAEVWHTPAGGSATQIVNELFLDNERVTVSPPDSLAWFYRGATTAERLPTRLTLQPLSFAAPLGNRDVILQSENLPGAALAHFTNSGLASLAVGEALVLRFSLRFDGTRRAPVSIALLDSGGSRATGDQDIASGVPAPGLFSGYRGYSLRFDPAGSGRLSAGKRTGSDALPMADSAFTLLGETLGVAPLHGGTFWTTVSLRVTRTGSSAIRIEGVGADANLIATDETSPVLGFDTVAISTAGAAGAPVVLRIDDVLVARSTPDGNATGPGTILSENFNGASPWPARALVTEGGAIGRASLSLGAHGVHDTLGSLVPGNALRLAVDAPAGVAWSASLDSGALTTSNSLADLRQLTLAFDLRSSRPRPVRVRLRSLVNNAELEHVIYPAAAGFYQRFAFELSDMTPRTGTFHPVTSLTGQVRLSFTLLGGPGEALGWPAGEHSIEVDNVHLARPRFYVSPTGVNTPSGGGESNPFATIQYAADRADPGDIILIRSGTGPAPHYIPNTDPNDVGVRLNRPGVPAGWITYKNYPGERPVIRNGAWGVVRVGRGTSNNDRNRGPEAAYIEVRGLELRGVASILPVEQRGTVTGPSNTNGISVEGRHSAIRPHHLRFADLWINDVGGAGIITIQADYVQVEGGVYSDNCTTNIYGMSGLSLYAGWDYAGPPDTYRKVVHGLRAENNRSVYPWSLVGTLSDGNGIIIDCNLNTQFDSVIGPYPGRTLVQNNLVVRNGGSGLHTFLSRRVDIVNNTAYANSRTILTGYGEMFSNASDDVRFVNNIMVATDGRPLSYVWNTTTRPASLGTVFFNTLFDGGNLPAGNGTMGPTGTGNLRATRAIFADPVAGDFRLAANSQGIDRGLATLFTPAIDITGLPRATDGTADAGALEREPAILRRPPATIELAPGETTTLQVVALGSALTHQWHRGGVPIAGATGPSLALPLPGGADPAGVYQLAISTGVETVIAAETSIVSLTPRQAWRRAAFGTSAATGVAADDADPDGDGLQNLLEYALGRDPVAADAGGATSLARSGADAWAFSFLRARGDVTYVVEQSVNLVDWTVVAHSPVAVGGVQTVPIPVPPASGAVFVRLRVSGQ
jgi:hypothetical protein